jgi:hypothetical protein
MRALSNSCARASVIDGNRRHTQAFRDLHPVQKRIIQAQMERAFERSWPLSLANWCARAKLSPASCPAGIELRLIAKGGCGSPPRKELGKMRTRITRVS